MLGLFVVLAGCRPEVTKSTFPVPPVKEEQDTFDWPADLTQERYRDKVLGSLIGSAIGDAMGAPVEMWHRDDIEIQWGYIDAFKPVIREGSPEGPWDYNLPPGGTTDDTRWKYLMVEFYASIASHGQDDADHFGQYIIDLYLAEKDEVGQVDDFDPASVETEIRHMTWLQEWAKVARPYVQRDLDGYSYALNKFYGGEMACAGMLYTPMVGLRYPDAPEKAYASGYELGLFDIGYARDIAALTAAYVSRAMQVTPSMESIGAVTNEVDPNGYFESRLVGRIAHRFHQDAKRIAHTAWHEAQDVDTASIRLPRGYPYSRGYYQQVQKAYELLDEKLQDIPFHAGEIHLINLTALEFGKGDFRKTMEFVVNYGRDNDTVAAVTGAILGAMHGASKLPPDWVDEITRASREFVGIDLEALADRMVASSVSR